MPRPGRHTQRAPMTNPVPHARQFRARFVFSTIWTLIALLPWPLSCAQAEKDRRAHPHEATLSQVEHIGPFRSMPPTVLPFYRPTALPLYHSCEQHLRGTEASSEGVRVLLGHRPQRL